MYLRAGGASARRRVQYVYCFWRYDLPNTCSNQHYRCDASRFTWNVATCGFLNAAERGDPVAHYQPSTIGNASGSASNGSLAVGRQTNKSIESGRRCFSEPCSSSRSPVDNRKLAFRIIECGPECSERRCRRAVGYLPGDLVTYMINGITMNDQLYSGIMYQLSITTIRSPESTIRR